MTAFVYDLIYTVPLSVASVILAGSVFGIHTDGMILPVTVICAVFIVLFGHFGYRGRLFMCGAVVTLAAGMWFVGKGDVIYEHLYILWILLTGVICFGLHIITVRYKKLKWLMMAVCISTLIISVAFGSRIDRIFVGMLFFCVLAYAVELIQTYWKKEGDTTVKDHIVYILPFLAVLLIPYFCARIPDKPYDWKFVKELIENAKEGYEALLQSLAIEDGWDDGDNIGFSQRAYLGGKVQGDPYKALTVMSDHENDYRLYLEGKSFDSFDGRRWTKNDDSDTDYLTLDLLETVAATVHEGEDFARDHMKRVRVRIKYEGIRTKCVFTPPKSAGVVSVDADCKGGDLKLKRGKRGDYYICYYRINRDDRDFERILNEERIPDESDWENAFLSIDDTVNRKYTYEDYLNYREKIYGYNSEPAELSDRTVKLMDELLSGATSDFEKLERIEDMLRGYGYTTSPGDIPDSVTDAGDYVDYFLFDKKEGFCTHFATVFVLLARSQGIAARYVQGYSVLSKVRDFEVRSDRTHAWPEAYIDGVGWMIFEPTPGYKQRSGWDIGPQDGNKQTAVELYKGKKDETADTDEEEITEDNIQKDTGKLAAGIRRILVYCLFAAVFMILFLSADRIYQIYRYRRMDDRSKLKTLCDKNMRMLRFIGLTPLSGETLGEFGTRIRKTVPDEIQGFIAVYERILYSLYVFDAADVTRMEKCHQDCMVFVRNVIIGRLTGKNKKNLQKNEIGG